MHDRLFIFYLITIDNVDFVEKFPKYIPGRYIGMSFGQDETFPLLKEKSKLTFVDLYKYIHCMFIEGKPRTVFFLQTLYLRYLSRRLKKSNMRAGRTWSWVSSGWENIKRNVEPWMCQTCCRTLQKEVLQTCSDLGIHFVVCRFASSVYK